VIIFQTSKKKKEREGEKEYSIITLRYGDELSQETPVWPHKSFTVFQLKLFRSINELYQFIKIVLSLGCKIPIRK